MKKIYLAFSSTILIASPLIASLPSDSLHDAAPIRSRASSMRETDTTRPDLGEGLKELIAHPFFQESFNDPHLHKAVERWVAAENDIKKAYETRCKEIGVSYWDAHAAFRQSPADPEIVARWTAHKAAQALQTEQINANDQVIKKYGQAGYERAQKAKSLIQAQNNAESAMHLFDKLANGPKFGLAHDNALSFGYWHIAACFESADRADAAASADSASAMRGTDTFQIADRADSTS